MPNISEFFDYAALVANPKPFLSALIAGCAIGFWFCKITRSETKLTNSKSARTVAWKI